MGIRLAMTTLALLLGWLAAGACNTLSGVDKILIVDPDGGGGCDPDGGCEGDGGQGGH